PRQARRVESWIRLRVPCECRGHPSDGLLGTSAPGAGGVPLPAPPGRRLLEVGRPRTSFGLRPTSAPCRASMRTFWPEAPYFSQHSCAPPRRRVQRKRENDGNAVPNPFSPALPALRPSCSRRARLSTEPGSLEIQNRCSVAAEWNHRALEGLHDPHVHGGFGLQRGEDLRVVVEDTVAPSVGGRGRVVVSELQAVDPPPAAVVVLVPRGGRGDVELLGPEKLGNG